MNSIDLPQMMMILQQDANGHHSLLNGGLRRNFYVWETATILQFFHTCCVSVRNEQSVVENCWCDARNVVRGGPKQTGRINIYTVARDVVEHQNRQRTHCMATVLVQSLWRVDCVRCSGNQFLRAAQYKWEILQAASLEWMLFPKLHSSHLKNKSVVLTI